MANSNNNNRLIISEDSLEFIRLTVYSENEFGPTDPTSFPVSFAFRLQNSNNPLVFNTGQWTTNSAYYAKILIGGGTGGLILSKGDYEIWLKIGSGTEIPVRQVGRLIIQ